MSAPTSLLTVGRTLAGGHVPVPLAAVPDAELVACLVEHGQPQQAANELLGNSSLRFIALRFWSDVQDARRGDKKAMQRVEYCRSEWNAMRRTGIITDTIKGL